LVKYVLSSFENFHLTRLTIPSGRMAHLRSILRVFLWASTDKASGGKLVASPTLQERAVDGCVYKLCGIRRKTCGICQFAVSRKSGSNLVVLIVNVFLLLKDQLRVKEPCYSLRRLTKA
jgi:hypothetical protein